MSHVRRELDRRTLHYCNKTWVRLPAHATNVSQIYFWHLVLAAFSFWISHGWCIKFLVDKTKNVSVLTRQDTSLSGKYHPPSLSLFWSQGVWKIWKPYFWLAERCFISAIYTERDAPFLSPSLHKARVFWLTSPRICCWCPCGSGPVSAPAGGPGPGPRHDWWVRISSSLSSSAVITSHILIMEHIWNNASIHFTCRCTLCRVALP